tara:strand:- start:1933 stop:2352 length:420 start_codon:yes stop_codon:yes gene_type:complete
MLSKDLVLDKLNDKLVSKLESLKISLIQTIESRNSDTKSSAGDKFETSREMAQIEIKKLDDQIKKTQQFLFDLKADTSLLIKTDKGFFFICIAYGKLIISEDIQVICISNLAPISNFLLTTEIGMSFNFNKIKYTMKGK